MDLLSETLLSLKIKNMLLAKFNLSAPWGYSSDGYHGGLSYNVLDNSCWLRVEGYERVKLYAGDSFLVPRGGLVSLSSGRETEIQLAADVWDFVRAEFEGFEYHPPGAYREGSWGGGGEGTRLLGVLFEVEESSQSALFNALPEIIIIRRDECPDSQALKDALLSIASEDKNAAPGEYAIRNNVIEALLRSQLRAHVTQTDYTSGIFAAVKDRHLHKVLVELYKRPHQSWSIESMADCAGLSRAGFAARFRKTLGETPINYLHQHRMQLASKLLRETQLKIEMISENLGYKRDRVFRSQFRKAFGMTPKEYRKAELG